MFYPDLQDERFTSSNYALYHQRYSTNTFPAVVVGATVPDVGP